MRFRWNTPKGPVGICGQRGWFRMTTLAPCARMSSVNPRAKDAEPPTHICAFAGDASKGNRPSFVQAARPEIAEPLVERFARRLETEHALRVARGVFGGSMRVELVNDGPVTIIVERRPG